MKVNCLNPSVIINPLLHHYLRFCDKFFFFDRCTDVSDDDKFLYYNGLSLFKVFKFPYVDFKSLKDNGKSYQKYIDECFFLCSETSEVFPLYVEVPCGHCTLCCDKRVNSYVQRATFQIEQDRLRAWFVTLTYNDDSLPVDGVSVRDVQLFKKRFKRNVELFWLNKGDSEDVSSCKSRRIKFLVSSEYTPQTHRPHYHILIFGLEPFSFSRVYNRYEVTHMCQYCWRSSHRGMSYVDYCKQYPKIYSLPKGYDPKSNGFVNVVECNNASVVSYITKYSSKYNDDSSNVPLGKNPNFVLCSINLGLDFAKSLRQSLIDDPDCEFKYCSYFDNKLVTCKVTSYYLKKLFPSLSTLIPLSVRRDFDNLMLSLSEMLSSPEFTDFKIPAIATMRFFNGNFPHISMDLCITTPSSSYKSDSNVALMLDDVGLLCQRLMAYYNDYSPSDVNQRLLERSNFLSRLSVKMAESDDLAVLSFNSKVKRSVLLNKTKLH